MGTRADAKDTKRTAMLLAEAMDQLQSLFIDTARARVGSGPRIGFNEWDRRKHEALTRRESAAAIGSTLESRTPQGVIDQPAFRRSPTYPFYVASRRGLARQFSAVDIMHIASNLFWVAQEDDDAELAAATAEHANELGQYALYLLQAAPTLKNDAASVEKMEVLLTSLEKSYAGAKVAMEQAVAAIERLNKGQASQEAAPQTTDQSIPATIQAIGSVHKSNLVGGNAFRVDHTVRILVGSYEGFRGKVHSISDDGGMLRVIVSVFGRDTVLDLDVTDVSAES